MGNEIVWLVRAATVVVSTVLALTTQAAHAQAPATSQTPPSAAAENPQAPAEHPPAKVLRTGAYTLVNIDTTYGLPSGIELSGGFKNLLDDYYELAWGFPQTGRTFYLRTRVKF